MSDPAADLRARVRRLAAPLGIDPERVEVRIYKLERGYVRGLQWRACVWVSRPGRSWSIDDARGVGDDIAADERGESAEDAARRALSWLRTRIEERCREHMRAAKRSASDAEICQRALDALDGGGRG